jgi:hypothetical protein
MTIPGDATKFAIPATSNGRVYIGTRGDNTNGQVIGYGVAPPSAPPVQAATTTLPQTSVSATTSKDVSITAKNTVTITQVAASTGASNSLAPASQFAVGQALVVKVTYAPQRPGSDSGSLAITDSSGKRLTIPLSGSATASVSRVTAADSTVDFGPVPVGQTATKTVHVTNTGNVPATVSVPAVPRPPFHSRFHVFAGLPFNPGYSLTIPVTFTPARAGTFSAPYVFHWQDRLGSHSLTVTLTGTGVSASPGGSASPSASPSSG